MRRHNRVASRLCRESAWRSLCRYNLSKRMRTSEAQSASRLDTYYRHHFHYSNCSIKAFYPNALHLNHDRPLPVISQVCRQSVDRHGQKWTSEVLSLPNKDKCNYCNQTRIAIGQAFGKKVFSFQVIRSGLTDFLSARHLLTNRRLWRHIAPHGAWHAGLLNIEFFSISQNGPNDPNQLGRKRYDDFSIGFATVDLFLEPTLQLALW